MDLLRILSIIDEIKHPISLYRLATSSLQLLDRLQEPVALRTASDHALRVGQMGCIDGIMRHRETLSNPPSPHAGNSTLLG